MRTKLELLSPNMGILINKIIANDNVVKLINSNDTHPFPSALPANRKDLILTKVFPFPESPTIDTEMAQIRVYYPEMRFINGGYIEKATVFFDILCHNNLMLIKDNTNNTLIRPDEIAKNLISQFDGKSIDTIGELKFDRRVHLVFNNHFQLIRLVAEMFTIA